MIDGLSIYETDIYKEILYDSTLSDLCLEKWHTLNRCYCTDSRYIFNDFVLYLECHFYDLICKDSLKVLNNLFFDFFTDINFNKIGRLVIDYYKKNDL